MALPRCYARGAMTTTARCVRPVPLLFAALLLALAGCATRPPLPAPRIDGPEARPPPDLMQVPDALPALEPIREGGPNKPYAVLGETYTPLPPEAPLSEQGLASWYGRAFHGRRTASGEVYNMYAMSAAHRTLPLPSFARVTNPANGRVAIVRVNDRGPFVKGRIIDLSYTAALKLGLLGGVAAVWIERITPDEIRHNNWQGAPPAAAAAPVIVDGDEPPSSADTTAPAVPAPPATPEIAATPMAPQPTSLGPAASRGFWLQLGAFRARPGAEQLQSQAGAAVEGIAPMLTVFNERSLYRVQAGPFASRDEAQRAAERLREKLLLSPLVVERR
jgi:rare lipoprotein A